RVTETYRKSYH
ncbi:unnamed protein product, partial [Allacma fusca]